MEDLENILEDLVPSTLDQGYAAVPKISWDEVGALDKVKEVLKKLILRQVELAGQSEENMMQTSGILLYGPPGTGKTMIAKALANEANLNFLAIKGPELLNMYLGESERMLKECFERAQNSAPCVLFFDEIDTLCPARKDHRNDASSRLVGTMLTQMSGITPLSQVYLVATTNRPDSLDPALTRSGRFSTHLYVGLPNPEERYQILKTILSKRTTLLGPQLDLRDVAHKCHNYSGSDLHELVTQALNIHIACKQDISRLQLTDFQLSTLHFEAAMHLVKPSNSEDSLSFSKLSIPSDALQSEGSKKRKRESDGNSHLARPAKIPASVLQQEDAGMISLSQPNAELTQTDQFATIISQLAALSQSSSQPPGSLEPSQGIKETTVSEESLFSKYLFNKPPQSDEEYDPLIPNMPPDHELHLLDEKKLLKSSIHVSCCFSSMPFNKSILVHGPPGTGKRTFIRALGALNRVRVVEIDLKLRCNFNEIAFVKKLNRYYEQALAQAPCILYLNRLDYYEKNDAKIVCDALASFIERLETQDRDKHVMVAVSVRDTASLTPELLQACPDSFSLQHPTEIQCKKILESLDPDADVDFEELAKELPGVEYGDLLNLSNLAGQVKQGDRSTIEDYRSVLRLPHVKILPSKHEKPDISWGSVGGMEHVKKTLKLEILTRVKHRKVFEHLGMAGSSGIILCGPPGTGKTLVASVIASEAGLNFISVKGPELLNMYVGESERNIRECFAKAKSQAPCIICFDEIDSLCMRRQNSDEVMNRVVGTLLSELNGLHPRNQVFVIGTTNRFTSLDPAVLRTGRLGLHLYVDLPTPEERVQVLKAILSNLPTVKMHNEEDLVKIAHSEKCANFTGADLNELVSKVVMEQRYVSNSNPLLLSLSHFEEVLSSMKPSLKPQDLAQYLETRNLINRNMEYRRKLFELLPHKDGFLH
ncbi:RIX7 [Cordylochernes scorpioides]|uniref:RIX7 n=1 Tax=Cordylochernes scorpioides TaxID=51811 RepID=A0ABY6KPC6_9ARAC|nr:RIX7 [Cordylochernes scorpioides]